MRVLQIVLLGAALMVPAGSGALRANGILQSSEPFLINGYGTHSYDAAYSRDGGYEMSGSGTNGIDTLSFVIVQSGPFGVDGVGGKTVCDTSLESFGLSKLYINDIGIPYFDFCMGDQSGFMRAHDEQYDPIATVGVIGFFHQVSYWSGSPPGWGGDGPRLSEGYFSITPFAQLPEIIAPTPEPDMAMVSALILGCFGMLGIRRRKVR